MNISVKNPGFFLIRALAVGFSLAAGGYLVGKAQSSASTGIPEGQPVTPVVAESVERPVDTEIEEEADDPYLGSSKSKILQFPYKKK